MSWSRLAAELSASFAERPDIAPIAASTLSGMPKRTVGINANIAMPALRWLGRTPEEFTPGAGHIARMPIPDEGPGHLLRWNGPQLYTALDERRQESDLTWRELARALGHPERSLQQYRLSYGAGFPSVMRATVWLGRPAAGFVFDLPCERIPVVRSRPKAPSSDAWGGRAVIRRPGD